MKGRKTEPTVLGKQLRIRRAVDGISASALAKRAGVSLVTLYNYEQGRCSPSVRVLQKLAVALGVSESTLLDPILTVDLRD